MLVWLLCLVTSMPAAATAGMPTTAVWSFHVRRRCGTCGFHVRSRAGCFYALRHCTLLHLLLPGLHFLLTLRLLLLASLHFLLA